MPNMHFSAGKPLHGSARLPFFQATISASIEQTMRQLTHLHLTEAVQKLFGGKGHATIGGLSANAAKMRWEVSACGRIGSTFPSALAALKPISIVIPVKLLREFLDRGDGGVGHLKASSDASTIPAGTTPTHGL